MFDELGIGEVIDQATQQNPDMRIVTVVEIDSLPNLVTNVAPL
jgi:cellulase/cellobiase CelA1